MSILKFVKHDLQYFASVLLSLKTKIMLKSERIRRGAKFRVHFQNPGNTPDVYVYVHFRMQ